MKQKPNDTINHRCVTQCALAAATLFLGACSSTLPMKNATERHGQVQFSSAKEQIVGEIVIRHDKEHFRAEITKGPGVPLLTISATFATDAKSKESKERQMVSSHVSGPMARGGLTYSPKSFAKKGPSAEKLSNPNYAWTALPEVFMWGEGNATGDSVRVTLPDLAVHTRSSNGHVSSFDYSRHQNPTGEPLPLRDLKKQPQLEKVICRLD